MIECLEKEDQTGKFRYDEWIGIDRVIQRVSSEENKSNDLDTGSKLNEMIFRETSSPLFSLEEFIDRRNLSFNESRKILSTSGKSSVQHRTYSLYIGQVDLH